MRPSRFTNEQVERALADVAQGTPLVTVCRSLGVTQTTFYRWRAKHGNTAAGTSEARALRAENVKLKELVANLSLERQFLQETVDRLSRGSRKGRDA